MMKKILIPLLLCLISLCSFSQFTNSTALGGSNANTNQTSAGGLSLAKMLKIPLFTDTAAANNGVTEKYAGSVIFTTSDNNFWVRNLALTVWIKIKASNVSNCVGLQFGGVVTLNTGLILNVTNANYCIQNVNYNSPSTVLTLATADPTNPRKDNVVVDITGNAVIVTGTPSNPAIAPAVNPATQVLLATIDIPAAATTPSNISNRVVIFNENTSPEWVPATTNLLSGSVNFNSTSFPYDGTIDADFAVNTIGTVQFPRSDTIYLGESNVAQLFIRLKAALPTTSSIQVQFTLTGVPVSNQVTLDNTNGFVKTVVGSYQNVSIPFPSFQFPGGLYADGMQIKITGNNGGFYLDYIQLQNSVIPNQDSKFWTLYTPFTATAAATLTDTFYHRNINVATAAQSFNSPIDAFVANQYDSVAGISRARQMGIFLGTSKGISTTPYALIIKDSSSGKNVAVFNSTGVVQFWDGIDMSTAGTNLPLINSIFPIQYRSAANGSAPAHRFNTTGANTLTGAVLQTDLIGSYSPNGYSFKGLGNADMPLFVLKSSNTGFGTLTPNSKAFTQWVSSGKGLLFPSMNTAQRDGINKFLSSISVGAGGSGYANGANVSIAASPVGGIQAVAHATVVAGVVTAIVIDEVGSGYSVAPVVTITPVVGGSGATATASVTTSTLTSGMTIYNQDSTCNESFNGSTWDNMRQGSTGGGSPQTWQQSLITGSTLTQDNFIDDNSSGAHQLAFGNNVPFGGYAFYTPGTFSVDASNISFNGPVQFNGNTFFENIDSLNTAQNMVWVDNSGLPHKAAVPSGGGVSSVAFTAPTALFTVTGSPITSSGTIAGTLTNSAAHKFWGNFTGSTGAPSYSTPTLASADFANQGTTTTVLHGNASGNPSWGAVSLTADVSGVLPAANGGRNPDSLVIAVPPLVNTVVGATIEQSIHSAEPNAILRFDENGDPQLSDNLVYDSAGQVFKVAFSGTDIMEVDGASRRVRLGDYRGLGNGNNIDIQDAGDFIHINGTEVNVTGNFTTNGSTVTMGGTFEQGNPASASLIKNDGTITSMGDIFLNGSGTMVRVNPAISEVGIGDVDRNANKTILTVNDASGTIEARAANFVATGAVQFSSYPAGALVTDGSGNITATSDSRVKHDIKPLNFGIKELNKVNPSTFIYNKDTSNLVMPGFIAQNVQEAFGGLGVSKGKDRMLSLNTNVILATLVNVVKAQQKEIDLLRKQIKKIKK